VPDLSPFEGCGAGAGGQVGSQAAGPGSQVGGQTEGRRPDSRRVARQQAQAAKQQVVRPRQAGGLPGSGPRQPGGSWAARQQVSRPRQPGGHHQMTNSDRHAGGQGQAGRSRQAGRPGGHAAKGCARSAHQWG